MFRGRVKRLYPPRSLSFCKSLQIGHLFNAQVAAHRSLSFWIRSIPEDRLLGAHMVPVISRLSIVSLILILSVPAMARAGWMGFRNDTSATLVIQETLTVGTSSRQGKPQKIFSTETVRDTPASSVTHRSFTISDSAHPDKPLFTGRLPCPATNENVLYVLKLDGKGGLIVEAVKSPIHSTKSTPKR